MTGIIGVFGHHYLSSYPCHPGDANLDSKNYYQWINGNLHHFNCQDHFDENGEVEVVAVDGIWFAMRKELSTKISFDEDFNGFHFYDMDICMQTWWAGYKVKAINDITIEHKNTPNINRAFVNATWQFYKKWQSFTPMIKGIEVPETELKIINSLCRYKNYARELQCQLDEMKASKWYKLGKKVKHLKKWIRRK